MSEHVQSYPTAKSRVAALAAVIIVWAYFGARALHESWAPTAIVPAVIAGALLALSRSFNVEARFRAPRNAAEERRVRRLRVLNSAGAIGMVISVVWVLIAPSEDFVVSLIAPLVVFLIAASLQGTSAVLYRPFLMKDGQPQ